MNMETVETSDIPLSTQVESLELSVNQLISLCNKLSEENLSYKDSNKQLMLERSELQLKNDKVRRKVEAMVDRLKIIDKAS